MKRMPSMLAEESARRGERGKGMETGDGARGGGVYNLESWSG